MTHMCLALAFALSGATAAPQNADEPMQTFVSKELGIELQVPKAWKISRRRNGEAEFAVPMQGATAEVEVFPTDYRREKDVWQTIQLRIAEQMRQKVERQWSEELLGVSLLLTRTSFERKGVPYATLTGLLYTSQRYKLHFRLSASLDRFDDLEATWRKSLESIKTTSGRLPSEGDPNKPVEVAPPKPPKVFQLGGKPEGTAASIVKAPVVVETSDGENQVFLRIPEGWTATKDETGKLTLSHRDLSRPLVVRVESTSIAGPPPRILMQASAASLSRYREVKTREEPNARLNKAGSIVVFVRRSGSSAAGPLFTIDAMGASQENGRFWLFSHSNTDAATDKREEPVLLDLIEKMSVETSR
ncbi:MAG: hypothetical protein KIS66_07515 [Fimbriimonadaceae bacterium]|nr:hypothetical protein [Fimbriimonadaceae bacterium]